MKNGFVKGLLAFCGAMASVACAIAAFLLIFKKFFTVSIEFTPKYENDVCDCGECEDCCPEESNEESDEIEFNLCEDEVDECQGENA